MTITKAHALFALAAAAALPLAACADPTASTNGTTGGSNASGTSSATASYRIASRRVVVESSPYGGVGSQWCRAGEWARGWCNRAHRPLSPQAMTLIFMTL